MNRWRQGVVILLLRQRERLWSVDELWHELRSSRAIVVETLGHFSDLVEEQGGGGVRYAPRNPEIDELVCQLEKLYAERPMSLMKTILSAPSSKIQSFADAFKFRKD